MQERCTQASLLHHLIHQVQEKQHDDFSTKIRTSMVAPLGVV
jgi:hypothetical protein